MYDYQDFSKRDKKLFDPLLLVAINSKIRHHINTSLPDHLALAQSRAEDLRPAYWKLNDSFKEFSKHLVWTFDDFSHRNLPRMIIRFLIDGFIEESDLAEFSDAGKEKLREMEERMRK